MRQSGSVNATGRSAIRLLVGAVAFGGWIACKGRSAPVPTPIPNERAKVAASTTAAIAPEPTPAPPPKPLASDEAIVVPEGAAGRKPFVLWLHGYGADSAALRGALHLPALAAERDFAWSAPNGLVDSRKRRFWNAGACCDYDGSGGDDVARLSNILAHAAENPRIDPARIYVVGFSNGGFMAHRLACASRTRITGFASLAGGGGSPGPCAPAGPTAAIQVHGDADVIVRMAGGSVFDEPRFGAYPPIATTMSEWSRRNRCSGQESTTVTLLGKPGDTTVLAYSKCVAPVQLWTLARGGHLTVNASPVVRRVLDTLFSVVGPG